MDVLVERGCGLDVHQKTVVACWLSGRAGETPRKVVRTFSTMTRAWLALRDWLRSEGCTHVAMESTGIYWKPVYAILEGSFELVVGNAQRIKHVPGRKTDVKDSEWIAQLLRHGLIANRFVPPKPIRELRDLLRYRRKLVESRSAERNRLLKLLETANIKLSSVVADGFGVSGTAMLQALLDGQANPATMAQLAKGRRRAKVADLELALEGRLEEHHRFLLRLQLQRLEQVEKDLVTLAQRIEARLQPYEQQRKLLMEIPGVDRQVAAVIIAELGVDMTVFRRDHQAAAWVGVCPGNNESAGKRKSGHVRPGNTYLKTALIEAAQAAAHTHSTYLRDKYFRLKARRGYQRAIMAIAHKILIAAYPRLSSGASYKELGDTYLDQRSKEHMKQNLVRRLERLGFDVTIAPKVA